MALDTVASLADFRPVAEEEDEAASLLAALDGPALLLDSDHTVELMTEEAARYLALDPAAPRAGAPLAAMLARTRLAPDARAALARLALTAAASICRLRDAAGGGMVARRVALPRRRVAMLLRPDDPAREVSMPRMRADPLTGLAGRAGFHSTLVARLAAKAGALGLIVLDIDRFWIVNDTLGPQVGDQLLATLAARLRAALRGSDLPARLDGDEFAVLVGEAVGPAELEGLARRLMDGLSRPYLLTGQPVTVGLSAGIARAPENGTNADTLLRCATTALHAAKAAGKGRYATFTPEMQARSETRRQMETDLRRAFALRQFTLHYQPQVDVTTNRLFGFEALLRWRHPSRGAVSPGQFVPLAEEIGLIAPIGAWVLALACKEAAGWPVPLTVSVNVSALQFEQGDLLAAVDEALARSGLAAHRLEIEVTESALLGNSDATLAVLRQLRASGVRIAMDDFGTGYSSLTRLQSFPFDKIKIDRSFISGPRGIAEGRAIVRAITGLGASPGMRTIAEGVETEEQLERVRAEGCTEVQGYLFGRPMPPAELPGLITGFAAPDAVPAEGSVHP
ncbi:MAG: putative bifunctional diguanylate cyclase/phosphodiesterase [Acetobacteraceae bacterium]